MGGTLCKIGSPLLSFLLCSLCTPLQNMYKKSKKGEHRAYANSLIEEVVIDVLKNRKKITNEMWNEGQQLQGV